MTKEIKQEQGKPVAWLIDDKSINHLQIKTIQRLIERANHAHMTDIKLRINGQDEWYEGDWIKHMVEAPQPKQEQGEQLARLGWQEIDCPICGGGARAFPKQEQGEPVAWMSEDEHTVYTSKQVDGCFQHDHIPLYTTPQRTWVGLTEEDLKLLSAEWRIVYGAWMDDFARDIEAKLKEKNNG